MTTTRETLEAMEAELIQETHAFLCDVRDDAATYAPEDIADDDGTRHTLDGPPTPEMLAAINDYERQKHDAMVWPEYLGDKPQFTPPVPEAGIQPCRMISPYGSFI